MRPFSVAGIQMYVSAVHDNVPVMLRELNILMSVYPWVQMVVFSELCPRGPLLSHAQAFPNAAEAQFREAARHHGVWLVPGTMFRHHEGHIFNTASVINPAGEVIGRFDKLFPFYPYEEGVTGGTEFLVWDVPDAGRFGITICYDIWFPETSRKLAVEGVEVLLHPTLTGTIDRDIELHIAQATAATNQMFVFDINGVGDGGTGRSIICGPDGRVLYQANTGPERIPMELDLDRVTRSRERGLLRLGQPLKSFRDRRVHFDVYEQGRRFPHLDALGGLTKPTRLDKVQEALAPDPESDSLDPEQGYGYGDDSG